MSQTTRPLTRHNTIRSVRRHGAHVVPTRTFHTDNHEARLIAAASILFVLACLGLIIVRACYAH